MQVFKKYLDERLKDPEFNKTYFDNCAICPTTIRIVTEISESSILAEEIASACGISIETIRNLEAADKCCVTSVQKLCDYFNIPKPVDCLQKKKKS